MLRSGVRRGRRWMGRALRSLHPARMADNIRRDAEFRRAMKEYTRLRRDENPSAELLRRLVYGWGNEIMSAMPEYLEAILKALRSADGAALECGSGLSTLLLGTIAASTGKRIWSLENDRGWARRVRRALGRYGVRAVEVCHAPLRDYGDFTWYDPPMGRLPEGFSLVVCDGPPGDTPGGRYGLLPVMRERLRPGCTILLDDLHRPAEREIAARWARELGARFEVHGGSKPYAVMVVP
jgi:hypothetical protein